MNELENQESVEANRREQLLLAKVVQQSREERRIAAQLMAVRHEKEVMFQNRLDFRVIPDTDCYNKAPSTTADRTTKASGPTACIGSRGRAGASCQGRV